MFVSEFSLMGWQAKYDLPLGVPLPSTYANILLAHLGISRYLEETQCKKETGWQNGSVFFFLLTDVYRVR